MKELKIYVSALLFAFAVAQSASPQNATVPEPKILLTVAGKGVLNKAQFTATVDEQPVEVGRLEPAGDQPLYFIVLTDVSGSNHDNEVLERKTSLELFDSLLQAGHHGLFGDFNDELYLDAKTSSHDAAVKEMKQVSFRGGTALYDAVVAASRRLHKVAVDNNTRRILIILTDGLDNASHVPLKEAVKEAQLNGVQVFSVGIFGRESLRKSVDTLNTLTISTGGVPLYITEPRDVALRLLALIQNQYWLSLPPVFADNNFHSLRLTLDNKDLKVFSTSQFKIESETH